MEWTRKSRTRSRFKNKPSAFIFFSFFIFFLLFCLVMGCPLSCKTQDLHFQDCEKRRSVNSMDVSTSNMVGRRLLIGPGSSPPRCTSKCGKCTPCRPVHVSVPPGTPVTAEYYPEAWRCKCGNKYYIP